MTKPLQTEGRRSKTERENITAKVSGNEKCKMPRDGNTNYKKE